MSLLPHPFASLLIVLLWMVLTSFTLGQLILGLLVGFIAGIGYGRLTPDRVRLRRPGLIVRLLGRVIYDIMQSNIDVAWLLITDPKSKRRRSGFVRIPLELTEPNGLAVLATIVTATPGTAWIDYEPDTCVLLLHVFDLNDPAEWLHTIKNRYEAPLMEIFA